MAVRQILHIDQDAFFVSVELRKNPALRGMPVIIGGNEERGVVTSASYEARRFGVRSAMPSRQAAKLCPQAIFINGSYADYAEASREVTQILVNNAPVVEKASIDEHYIDLTGMDKYYGSLRFARELKQKIITHTGLPVSFGLSINKTVAKMATNACKPNGELEVQQDAIAAFLYPQPVENIPGLGAATQQVFNHAGIYTIAQLAAYPEDLLRTRLGDYAVKLRHKIMGYEGGELTGYRERKSIGTERTFSEDITGPEPLEPVIQAMVSKVAYELRSYGKLAGCLAVVIKYNNFERVTLQQTLPFTCLDYNLVPLAKLLLHKLLDKRRPVRLAGIRLSNLIYGYEQADIYGMTTKNQQLVEKIDLLRDKFGKGVIKTANTLGM